MLRQEIKDIQTDSKTLRKFGFVLTVFLAIIGGLSLWKSGNLYPYLFPAAGIVLIISLIFPKALKIIYYPWMVLATIIGWVMTRVILTTLFFGVLTPISFLTKMMGKDLLNEKIEPAAASYWIQRKQRQASKTDFERQF